MQLCLVRHAIAGERGPEWPDDRVRPLTKEGAAKMRLGARGLRTLFVPDTIVTSPLLRAVQTAEILCDAYRIKGLHISDALASGDDAALFADIAATRGQRVMAVGHEPWISATLSYCLVSGEGNVHSVYKKGAAALVGFDGPPAAGQGWLEWMLQPGALRAIGTSA